MLSDFCPSIPVRILDFGFRILKIFSTVGRKSILVRILDILCSVTSAYPIPVRILGRMKTLLLIRILDFGFRHGNLLASDI